MLRLLLLSWALALALLVFGVQSELYQTQFSLDGEPTISAVRISGLNTPMQLTNIGETKGAVNEKLVPCEKLHAKRRGLPKSGGKGCRVSLSCSRDGTADNPKRRSCLVNKWKQLSSCHVSDVRSVQLCDRTFNRLPNTENTPADDCDDSQDSDDPNDQNTPDPRPVTNKKSVEYRTSIGYSNEEVIMAQSRDGSKTLRPKTPVKLQKDLPCSVLLTTEAHGFQLKPDNACKVRLSCDGSPDGPLDAHHCVIFYEDPTKSLRSCGAEHLDDDTSIPTCDDNFLGDTGTIEDKTTIFQTSIIGAADSAKFKIYLDRLGKRLDPNEIPSGLEPLPPCKKLAVSRRPITGSPTGCKVNLECDGDPNARKCLIRNIRHKTQLDLSFCGSPSLEDDTLFPYCKDEDLRPKQKDTSVMYKTTIMGERENKMMALNVHLQKGRITRRTLGVRQLRDNTPVIPCVHLSPEKENTAPGGCWVELSCAGSEHPWTCKISDLRKKSLRRCTSRRMSDLRNPERCSFKSLGIDQDCDGDTAMTDAPGLDDSPPESSQVHLRSHPTNSVSEGSLDIYPLVSMTFLRGQRVSQGEPKLPKCRELPRHSFEPYGPQAGCQAEISCLGGFGDNFGLKYMKCRLN